jgi:hypothetical protein
MTESRQQGLAAAGAAPRDARWQSEQAAWRETRPLCYEPMRSMAAASSPLLLRRPRASLGRRSLAACPLFRVLIQSLSHHEPRQPAGVPAVVRL